MKKVTNKVLWVFAIGQLGWSILSGIVVNWLIFFYQPNAETVALGQPYFIPQKAVFLSLTVIGVISAVGRIFDAVTDPLIAGKSDSCSHRLGRRIPFLRYAAIPLGLVTVLMFVSPTKEVSFANSAWLFVTSLLFYFCLTCYCTPYNALIPELGRTQKDRINCSTYISVTYFLGTAIAYLLPNLAGIVLGNFDVSYANSYRIAIAILAVIAVICMLVPSFLIHEHDYANTTPTKTPVFKSLVKTYSNPEFRTFVFSDIFYWIALTLFQTGLPFYITSLMKLDSGMTFIFFALMTGLSLVCYTPVNVLAKKVGKKKMVVFAFFFFTCTFFITTFAGMFGLNGIVWGVIVSVLASIPMAILGILPQAIVADISEADSIETQENREGMFYAARTFAFKLGQSIAMLIFTGLSISFGYRVTALVAAIFCLIGGLILLRYNERKVFSVIQKDSL